VGFVEPVPEFYARLGKLVAATEATLKEAEAFALPDFKALAGKVAVAEALVARARKSKEGLGSLSPEERDLLDQFNHGIEWLPVAPARDGDSKTVLENLSRVLKLYRRLAKGDVPGLEDMLGQEAGHVASAWERLGNACRRLEALAHKQLRQVRFSDEENTFLLDYGKDLAAIMLYGGNSYLTPKDDAPRVIDVFSNPAEGKHLLVGIARPRALWVLYPVGGVDVLCRGAVLPYHEWAHSSRLTDAEWKSLLGTAKRPGPPAWIQPLIAGSGPTKKAKGKE
jgi:hypothetical protein